jgi:hypothetical protein
MKWMKFIDNEGDEVWLNMALAESFYASGEGSRIVFSDNHEWRVNEPPDMIIARGEWVVK